MARRESKYLFQQISKEGQAAGLKPGTIDSRDWFRDRAQDITRVNAQRLMTNQASLYPTLTDMDAGRMYMFFYDPKHKDKLPFYDRFPLIFMMEKYTDGFLGMNMHYLPLVYRARLMDHLYDIERNDSERDSRKLALSYGLLKAASKYKYFTPTVKRYLYSHVRSRFLYVPAEQWDIALMLPTERFKKARKGTVWKDSRKKITQR
jgi:hypothetical protein